MCEERTCWRNWKTFCLFETKDGKWECCMSGCIIGIFITFGVLGIIGLTHINNATIEMSEWTEIYSASLDD